MPNPLSLPTYCVCPEPRPLPSTGITRLHRYYEPLRHPKAPGLSLAGVRLLNRLSTPSGFPCCVRFPGVHAVATTPAQRLGASSARFPSHISLPGTGDPVGPRIVIFEVCSAFTHITACTLAGSPEVIRCIEGFSHFVTSMTAPTTSGWSIFAGWDSHPLESAAFSRRTPVSDGHGRRLSGGPVTNSHPVSRVTSLIAAVANCHSR